MSRDFCVGLLRTVVNGFTFLDQPNDCQLSVTVVNVFTFLDQPNDCQLSEDCGEWLYVS